MEYGSLAAPGQEKCRLAGARRPQYCCCLFPCEATMHGTGDSLSRRDWLAVLGAAGAGAVVPPGFSHPARPGRAEPVPILPLTSTRDRKSTRLNSSHGYISYAVFCLKKNT